MLIGVEAKNFKCFGEAGISLNLAPLTILVGPNGAGKSSVLDAIGLLAQSAPTGLGKNTFKWQGSYVDLGSDGRFAFNRANPGVRMRLGLSFSDGDALRRWQREQDFLPEVPFDVSNFAYNVEHSSRTDEWLHEIVTDGSLAAVNESRQLIQAFGAAVQEMTLRYPTIRGLDKVTYNPQVGVDALLNPFLFSGQPRTSIDETSAARVNKLQQELSRLLAYVVHALRNRVFIVGADRAPSESEPKRGEGPLRVGKHGEYTFAVLSILFASPESRSQANRVRHWAGVFGMESLQAGWVGEVLLRAGYCDSGSQTPLPVNLAGFGSRQILSVIAQLFCAPADSLIMIEEPEISLHPGAQIDLVRMFAEAIASGQQVLVTTHSQTLLLALSHAAKESAMKLDDVAVYHFSREREEVKATRLELDSSWHIRGWVPSFSDVESRLIREWIVNVRDKIKPED